MVIIKKNVMDTKYGLSEYEKVILDEPALIARALDLGEVEDRQPGITYHRLHHSGGIILVYTNTTSDQTLHETITFNCKNLHFKDEDGNMIEIKDFDMVVGPGE